MTDKPSDPEAIDWSLTTWEGSRREQLRRWSELSLEDMAEIAERFAQMRATETGAKQDPT